MIQIEDNDMPIDVAKKIITGTKVVSLSPTMKKLRASLTGNEEDECTYDMFEIQEIKEIADYLLVYYNTHPHSD